MKGTISLLFLLGAFPAHAGADSCTSVDAGYKLKSNLANQYCSSASTASAGCGGCCEAKPNTCAAHRAESCGSGATFDRTKTGTALTDKANFKTTCCKNDPMTCLDAISAGSNCGAGVNKFSDPAKYQVAIQADKSDYVAKCCSDDCTGCCTTLAKSGTQCGADRYYKPAASQSAATAANYDTVCCYAKGKCAGFSCPAGRKLVATASTKTCGGETCTADGECCEPDNTKCGGLTTACGSGTFQDPAKDGTAATAANFQATCCTAKATCSAFQAASPTASGALLPSVHAMTVLAIAVVLCGK